jgi:hypothetical protein
MSEVSICELRNHGDDVVNRASKGEIPTTPPSTTGTSQPVTIAIHTADQI